MIAAEFHALISYGNSFIVEQLYYQSIACQRGSIRLRYLPCNVSVGSPFLVEKTSLWRCQYYWLEYQ
jgi:hypothetical protein